MAAGEVNFTGDSLADPSLVIALCHLADELVPRRPGESVVSALEFKIGRADSGGPQSYARESLWNTRQRLSADFHASGFEVNGKHVV
jgi:hypothetical protein